MGGNINWLEAEHIFLLVLSNTLEIKGNDFLSYKMNILPGSEISFFIQIL
jgi:hypothetical protein